MPKTYSSSPQRVLLISVLILVVISLVFAFARGKFELQGLALGIGFGALLAVIPLVVGLGQKVELTDAEIWYSPHLLASQFAQLQKRNPNIKVDTFGQQLINGGGGDAVLRRTVAENFIWVALGVISIALFLVLLFRFGIGLK